MKQRKYEETIRMIIAFILYSVFIYFAYTQLVAAQTSTERWLLIALLLPILLIAVWYEWIRYLYRKIIYIYNFEVDIHRAVELMKKLRKFDFLQGFKNNEVLLMCFYYIDTNQPEPLNQLLDTYEKKLFKKSLDMLLVYNYNKMCYYQMISNKTQQKKYFEAILQLQNRKVKGKKISPLYNIESLFAQHYLFHNDLKKAYRTSTNVNTARSNPREQAYVYYYRYKSAIGLGKLSEAKEFAQMVIHLGNKLPIVSMVNEKQGVQP